MMKQLHLIVPSVASMVVLLHMDVYSASLSHNP